MQNYFDNNSTNYSGMYKIYSDFAPPVNEKTGSARHDDKQADLTRFDQVTDDLVKQQLINGNIVGVVKTYPAKYTEIGGIYGVKLTFTLDLFSLMDKTEIQTEANELMHDSDYKNSAVSSHTNATIPTIDTGNTYYIAWGYNKPSYAVLENTGYGRRQQLTIVGNITISLTSGVFNPLANSIYAGFFGDDLKLQVKYPTTSGLSDYTTLNTVLAIKPVMQTEIEEGQQNTSGVLKKKYTPAGRSNTVVVTAMFTRLQTFLEHFYLQSLDGLASDITNPYLYSLKFTLSKELGDLDVEWTKAVLLQVDEAFTLGDFVFFNLTFGKSV